MSDPGMIEKHLSDPAGKLYIMTMGGGPDYAVRRNGALVGWKTREAWHAFILSYKVTGFFLKGARTIDSVFDEQANLLDFEDWTLWPGEVSAPALHECLCEANI